MTKIPAYGNNVTNYLHKTKWSFPLHVIRSSGTGSLGKIEIPITGILILPRLPVPLPLPRLLPIPVPPPLPENYHYLTSI